MHLIVLVLAAVALPSVSGAITPLNKADRDLILKLHNDYRDQTTKDYGAAKMPSLVWNATLAQNAQSWTSNCVFQHQHSYFGENIAEEYGYGNTDESAIKFNFNQWTSEVKYNKARNFKCCSPTSMSCCHYTQVISARSTSVGCGLSSCPDGEYLACYYYPAGNFFMTTCDWHTGKCTTNYKPFPGA